MWVRNTRPLLGLQNGEKTDLDELCFGHFTSEEPANIQVFNQQLQIHLLLRKVWARAVDLGQNFHPWVTAEAHEQA